MSMPKHDASSGSTSPSQTRIIAFEGNDVDNPRNWPSWRKILAWLPLIVLWDNIVSFGASGFSPALMKFSKAFDVSTEVATLGLSMYVLGLALGPMINAPLSEYYGRLPVYTVSFFAALPLLAGSALVKNLGGFLVLRLLSGTFESVTIANVGGTIADLYEPHHTGYPVSIWIWAATGGSSLGFVLLSFVAQFRPWYDVFWALLGITGGAYIVVFACMLIAGGETRASVILRRRVAKLRAQGHTDVDVAAEHRPKPIPLILTVTLTRAFRFLLTEPVIMFGALYNGYLYGLSFLLNGAFSLVFGPTGHGFDTLQVGLAFLGIWAGISAGPITNIAQERYFQRRVRDARGGNVAEARLRMAKLAGVTFPVSLFWFAWTTFRGVPPVVPILASALFGWSFYTLILMTYTYTEDAYKQYAASALAGIGLVRNLAGAGFPLFGNPLFENEGFQWAGSILAFLALVLVPIPFVMERYGHALRRRSPWCAQHMEGGGEEEGAESKGMRGGEEQGGPSPSVGHGQRSH